MSDEKKVDVAEQIRRGEHLAIVRSVQGGEVVKPGVGFERSTSRVFAEREERLEMARQGFLSFGIPFLDDALGCMLPADVVLLGAATGVGKTELSRIVAMHNASLGKRVHFIALEAEQREIERRTKYGVLAALVQARAVSRAVASRMNFLDWMTGKIDDVTGPYEDEADALVREKLGTMQTFYRVKDFTVGELERTFDRIKSETDLVVIDHLHYIDTTDQNENRGYKVIVKKIRDCAQHLGKPVLVVAHLRKQDQRAERLVPVAEDFSGTKEIINMVTKAIILAPALDQEPHDERHRWKTYIAPVKCRIDGSRARYVALTTFNARTNTYERHYQLGRLTGKGTKFEPLAAAEMPAWASEQATYDLE